MSLKQKKNELEDLTEQKTFSTSSDEIIEEKALFTGVQINYFIHCKTQLWYFSHYVTQEHESELVILGKILHEIAFKDIEKDILIEKISIDFIKKGDKVILHDVKKSDKFQEAHYYQMLYYLYYLKHEKGIENVEGIINYPSKRKIVEVKLTPEKEIELQKIFQEIKRIVSLPKPPKPEKKKYCRKCSYFELCWINK
ncbi:MAG: CRISPR-associated protein Cas4 [Candidatus Aenigmatarchaeota archaeon]